MNRYGKHCKVKKNTHYIEQPILVPDNIFYSNCSCYEDKLIIYTIHDGWIVYKVLKLWLVYFFIIIFWTEGQFIYSV